jgi:exosome complex component RRP45
VWNLRLTIHFLADSGNMLDCACLAAIVALKHFRRPEVEVVGDQVIVVRLIILFSHECSLLTCPQHPPTERAPMPLSMHHTPFCLTFAYFQDTSIPAILDPNRLEQRLSAGVMSIALNAQRELCVVQKAGGVPLSPAEILRIVSVATEKSKELDMFVKERLEGDWKTRDVEVV